MFVLQEIVRVRFLSPEEELLDIQYFARGEEELFLRQHHFVLVDDDQYESVTDLGIVTAQVRNLGNQHQQVLHKLREAGYLLCTH